MPESMPSLELVAGEIRTERDALVRHLDALDAKAGIVLGSAGVFVAIGTRRLPPLGGAALALAVLSALLALAALMQQRFATGDVIGLRRYLATETGVTELVILDTSVVIIERLRNVLRRKVQLFSLASTLLALAVAATSVGTLLA